jgi:hypothetical protein
MVSAFSSAITRPFTHNSCLMKAMIRLKSPPYSWFLKSSSGGSRMSWEKSWIFTDLHMSFLRTNCSNSKHLARTTMRQSTESTRLLIFIFVKSIAASEISPWQSLNWTDRGLSTYRKHARGKKKTCVDPITTILARPSITKRIMQWPATDDSFVLKLRIQLWTN